METRRERAKRKKLRNKKIKLVLFICICIVISAVIILISFFKKNTNETSSNTLNYSDEASCFSGNSATLQISFAGNCMMQTAGKEDDFINSFSNIADIFKSDDYTIMNLESPLTDSEYKSSNDSIKGSTQNAELLKSFSVDAVNIANEHIDDYGTRGKTDTKLWLNKSSVDICDNNDIITKQIKGIKVAILGYCFWDASENTQKKIEEDIKKIKNEGAEYIAVYFHFGIEDSDCVCDNQKVLAYKAIDSGADVVIGSHPHYIQPFECYKGKLIVYSVGDIYDGINKNQSQKTSIIVQTKINFVNGQNISESFKVIPIVFSLDKDKCYIPDISTDNKILDDLNNRSENMNNKISGSVFELDDKE